MHRLPVNHLRDMALFVEVARTGSFTRAAQVLDIPLSSLSRRISEFEGEIGLQLLSRSTRRVLLTEVGREYYERCKGLVEQATKAHEVLRESKEVLRGSLRLSTTPDFGALMLAPLLGEFALEHPGIRFELDLTPTPVDLIANNIDLAIRFGKPPDSQYLMRQIGSIRHGLFATPGYLARYGRPLELEDLSSHAGIGMSHATKELAAKVTCGTVTRTARLDERFTANHLSMIRALALMDLGIAWIPEVIVRRDVAAWALERVLPAWQFPEVPVIALTSTRLLPVRVRVFLDFLIARIPALL